jgi:hypothetical protein
LCPIIIPVAAVLSATDNSNLTSTTVPVIPPVDIWYTPITLFERFRYIATNLSCKEMVLAGDIGVDLISGRNMSYD